MAWPCPVPPCCPCVLQHLRGADELHGAHRREARLLLAQPAGGRVLRGRAQAILQELLPVGPGPARPPERRAVSLHRAARAGHPADDSARGVEEQTQRGHRVGEEPGTDGLGSAPRHRARGRDNIAPSKEPVQRWLQGRTGCPASPSRSPWQSVPGRKIVKGKNKPRECGEEKSCQPRTHARESSGVGASSASSPGPVLGFPPRGKGSAPPAPAPGLARAGFGWQGGTAGGAGGVTGNGNKVLFLPK